VLPRLRRENGELRGRLAAAEAAAVAANNAAATAATASGWIADASSSPYRRSAAEAPAMRGEILRAQDASSFAGQVNFQL